MRSAPSQNYKLAKLTSDHQELLRQYNLLYNIAAEMHRQLTSTSTIATEPPPAEVRAAPDSDSSDEEAAARVKAKDEDESRKRKSSEELDQPEHHCFMAIADDPDQAYLSS